MPLRARDCRCCSTTTHGWAQGLDGTPVSRRMMWNAGRRSSAVIGSATGRPAPPTAARETEAPRPPPDDREPTIRGGVVHPVSVDCGRCDRRRDVNASGRKPASPGQPEERACAYAKVDRSTPPRTLDRSMPGTPAGYTSKRRRRPLSEGDCDQTPPVPPNSDCAARSTST